MTLNDMDGNVATVRACFASYRSQDREKAEQLIAPEYRFTSPQDERIDRAAFFEKCFPTADRFAWQRILEILPSGEHDVFVRYEYQIRDGGTFRNVEVSTVRDGKIVETQVYFGGAV